MRISSSSSPCPILMSEPEIISSPPPPPPVQESSSPPQNGSETAKPFGAKFSIWPPTQRTRDAVISRLIETLSKPSILSKRYGTVPQDEAASVARVIEEEAYVTAGGAFSGEDDGIETLQVYSKEISKRMLDAVKARETQTPPVENGATSHVITNEEIPSESS